MKKTHQIYQTRIFDNFWTSKYGWDVSICKICNWYCGHKIEYKFAFSKTSIAIWIYFFFYSQQGELKCHTHQQSAIFEIKCQQFDWLACTIS